MTFKDNKRLLEIGEVYKNLRILQVIGEEHLVVECIYCQTPRVINEEGINSISDCACVQAKKLEDQMFGKLRVIKATTSTSGGITCECECTNCGKHVKMPLVKLEKSKSCGCLRKRKNKYVGKQFGRLVVLEKAMIHTKKGHATTYVCQCTCPERNIVLKTSSYLRTHREPNCGCVPRKKRQY